MYTLFCILVHLPNGCEHGGCGGDCHGEDDGLDAGGDGVKDGNPRHGEAQAHGDDHQQADDLGFAARRHEDGDEHAVQAHGQGADHAGGQDIAHDHAEAGADGPAGAGEGDGAVGVEGVEIARGGDGHAEDLIGDIPADEQAVQDAGFGMQLLAQGEGHEQVAGIGHGFHHSHFEIARARTDEGEAHEFAGGGIDEEGSEGCLEGREPGAAGGDAQGEGHGQVTQADGHAGLQAACKPLFSGEFGVFHNGIISCIMRRGRCCPLC